MGGVVNLILPEHGGHGHGQHGHGRHGHGRHGHGQCLPSLSPIVNSRTFLSHFDLV